jgi:hypothetical protein
LHFQNGNEIDSALQKRTKKRNKPESPEKIEKNKEEIPAKVLETVNFLNILPNFILYRM